MTSIQDNSKSFIRYRASANTEKPYSTSNSILICKHRISVDKCQYVHFFSTCGISRAYYCVHFGDEVLQVSAEEKQFVDDIFKVIRILSISSFDYIGQYNYKILWACCKLSSVGLGGRVHVLLFSAEG